MKYNRPLLYVFSGLPGSGKSAIAKKLASEVKAAYLRIDTIEQGIRDLCSFKVQGEGYRLSYRIDEDNLKNNVSVIADSCNPIKLTRGEWFVVAENSSADIINIEVICSDLREHRKRVESRKSEIENLILPSWNDVVHREYHQWNDLSVITIDTANRSIEDSFNDLIKILKNKGKYMS